MKLNNCVTSFLFLICLFLSTVVNAQMYRLVEQVNGYMYQGSFHSYDSTAHWYSPTTMRGSNYSSDTVKSDSAFMTRNIVFGVGDPYLLYESTYDSNDMLVSVYREEYDKVLGYLPLYADSFVRSNGKVTEWRHYGVDHVQPQKPLVNRDSYKYFYDVNGKLVKIEEYWYGSFYYAPRLMLLRHYMYNANGLLIKDSVSTIDNIPVVWTPLYVVEYDYDVSNNRTSKKKYKIDMQGNRVSDSAHFYSYNSNDELIKDSMYSDMQNVSTVHTYTYNAKGYIASDTFISDEKVEWNFTTYDYTTFDYIKQSTRYDYDTTNNVYFPYYIRKYFYEEYWPLGIKETTLKSSDMVLYPNPATHVLYINTSEAYTQGRIYNSMGQLVQTVNANSKQVNIEALPAGSYYLQLTTNDKVMSKSFTIVR